MKHFVLAAILIVLTSVCAYSKDVVEETVVAIRGSLSLSLTF